MQSSSLLMPNFVRCVWESMWYIRTGALRCAAYTSHGALCEWVRCPTKDILQTQGKRWLLPTVAGVWISSVPSTIRRYYMDAICLIVVERFHTSDRSRSKVCLSNGYRYEMLCERRFEYRPPPQNSIPRPVSYEHHSANKIQILHNITTSYVRYKVQALRYRSWNRDRETWPDRCIYIPEIEMFRARIAGRKHHCLAWSRDTSTHRGLVAYLSIASQGHLALLAPSAGSKTMLRLMVRAGRCPSITAPRFTLNTQLSWPVDKRREWAHQLN